MTVPILQIQKRSRLLGRIRIGQKGAKGQPQKLDRFRITSASQALIEKIASLYGGEAQPWDNDGAPQWEVITDARRIPIMVPPQPVSQWLETWARGPKGCVHRCDGETNFLTGEPCDPEDPDHQNAKPTTRLNVILREVEGIGVFRLDSHGWNAAIELPDVAEFLAQVGGYVNGWLALEERTSKGDGKTRRFVVPTIEIDVTPAELMAGKGVVRPPAVGGPVAKAALESGPAGDVPDLSVYHDLLAAATTSGECMGVYEQAKDAGLFHGDIRGLDPAVQGLYAAIGDRGRELSQSGDGGGRVPGDEVGDPDAVWQMVLAEAGRLGWGLTQVVADFRDRYVMPPDSASAGELAAYLQVLRSQDAA